MAVSVVGLALVGVGPAGATGAATSFPVPACGPSLSTTVTPGPAGTRLLAFDPIAANNVWAVGSVGISPATSQIEHFDGTSWTVSPAPSLPGVLFAVASVNANDVWAVGRGAGDSTISEHWNGTQWTSVPMPTPPPPTGVTGSLAFLQGIAIRSTNDIWAVGTVGVRAHENAVLDHWDGTSWTAYPNPPANVELRYANIVPGGDIWAVGATYLPQSNTTNLALHFDGTTWQAVPTPNPSAYQNLLHGVVALSPTDAWAVGFDADPGSTIERAQSMHWDGTSWTLVPMVVPLTGVSRPRHVVALSSSDVWATGDDQAGALVEHWNGRAWSMVSGPQAIPLPFAIGSLGEGHVWISGNNNVVEQVCPSQVSDTSMGQTPIHTVQDLATAWHVTLSSTKAHSVTDATGLGLFDSGSIAPGGSYLVSLAGAGWYTVKDTQSTDTARVGVPVIVSPANGTTSSSFTIKAASPDLPSGLVEDVQIERPRATTWLPWKTLTSTTGFSATFTPDGGAGSYSFRSRTRNPATKAATDFSLTATITVSP